MIWFCLALKPWNAQITQYVFFLLSIGSSNIMEYNEGNYRVHQASDD